MKLIKFELFENTAKSTLGNTEGMGSVKAPQPKPKGEMLSDLPSKKKIPEPVVEETTENNTNESVKSFYDFILVKEDIINEGYNDEELLHFVEKIANISLYPTTKDFWELVNDAKK